MNEVIKHAWVFTLYYANLTSEKVDKRYKRYFSPLKTECNALISPHLFQIWG